MKNDKWQFVVRTSDFYLSFFIVHSSFEDLAGEAITPAVHGLNESGRRGIVSEFAAQSGYVLVDRAGGHLDVVGCAPDPGNQVGARYSVAAAQREQLQNLKFALRERHAPAVSPGFARTKIDDYVAGIEAPRGVVTGGAPQQSAYSSDELHKTEGLGNIVIGAELQTAHPVHLLPSRCQYQHQGVARSRSQFFEHVKAGDPGQHHIQYDEGVDPAERLLQSGAPVGGVSYLVTFQPERVAEPRRKIAVVLDKKHSRTTQSHKLTFVTRGFPLRKCCTRPVRSPRTPVLRAPRLFDIPGTDPDRSPRLSARPPTLRDKRVRICAPVPASGYRNRDR